MGPLLKSYQEEIDRLTSRAKHGESAFLDVYQKLYEAPDPAAALIAALVRGSCLCHAAPTEAPATMSESWDVRNTTDSWCCCTHGALLAPT